MNTKVSVIVPTFNRPERLRKALTSALNQEGIDFEILVVNDSQDESPVIDVINGLNDSRIRYFRNSRSKGANGARNTGIIEATGNLVSFLDDDDQWLPGKLKYEIIFLQKNRNFHGVFSSYKFQVGFFWKKKIYKISEISLKDVLLQKVNIGSGSNLTLHKSVFHSVGLWNERFQRLQDLEILVRILSESKIGYCNHVGLLVYGHNYPKPNIVMTEYKKFFRQVAKYVNRLDENEQKLFYSKYYRKLTSLYLGQYMYHRAYSEYLKAAKFQIVHFKKDSRLFLQLLLSLTTAKNN